MKRMLGKIRKRKYISTVLLSVALVFLFVIGGMIYKTQATGGGKAVIANAVTIGERTYTRDNPLNIIELVPDEAVGAWGYLTGMNNGAVKWSDIAGLPDSAAKHDLCNTWLNNYMKSIIEYNNYTIPENKNQAEYAGKNIYYRKNSASEWKLYSKDCANEITSDTEFKFNVIDNYGNKKELDIYDKTFVDEQGNNISGYNDNFFAYMVFAGDNSIAKGDYNMMDKIRVTSVSIDALTTDMIDNADAIIVSAGENISTYPAETYKKMYEYAQAYGDAQLKAKYPAKAGITDKDWSSHTWGNNVCLGKDFSDASVAGRICYKYLNQELSIIGGFDYNKIDKRRQENLMKMFVTITGIDRDTCLRDLCEYKVIDEDTTNEITGVYEGEYGRFDFDNMEIYIFNENRSNTYRVTYDTAGWINFNQGVFGKYLGEWPKVSNYYSNFPYKGYNVAPDRINENVFWFGYANNPLRSGFISTKINIKWNDNEFNQVNDVLKTYNINDGNIDIAKMIQYVLGGYKRNKAIEKLKVLEIQPSADYDYNTCDGAKSLLKYFSNAKFKINVSGITEKNYKRYIDVTSVTVNELNGMTDNIANNYDLVVIGEEHSKNLLNIKGRIKQNNGDTVDSYYYSQGAVVSLWDRSGNDTGKDVASAGNDITEKTLEKLKEYINMDKPVILASDIYNTSTSGVLVKDKNGKYTRTVDTNIYSVLPYARSVGKTSNITVEAAANAVVSDSDKIEYKFKPVIRQTIADAGLNEEDNTFTVKFKTDNTSGKYNVEFYIDKDANGVFVNAHDDTGELYAGGFSDTNPVVYTYNNGYITVTTTTLPKDLRPYLPWKLVIRDVSTGLTAETTGILRINVPDEKQEDVKILQIMPDIDSKHDYSLKLNDSDFMKLFNDASGTTGLRINKKDVDIVTVKELCEGDNKGNDWYKNSRYTAGTSLNKDGEDLLKDYTIVVLGFADAFDNITNTHALANLRDYIESGKAVLMTHDTIGQYSYTDENTDETESLFAGDDSDIRRAVPIMIDDKISKGYMFTTAFRNIVGMDMYHVTVGQAKENLSYQQGYTNTIVTRYGVLPGYDYKNDNNYIYKYNHRSERTVSSLRTNAVSKINDGQITSYPYTIPDNLNVAETHAQYYLLDLEKQDDTASSIDSGGDVVVWYTLGQGTSKYSESDYFSVTGNDAANNYYIYSKGNVTYSGAGHSTMSKAISEDELKLFVNTIIWSINSGNNAPQITIENAVMADDGIYEMYSLDGSIPDIQFVATDIDMGSDTSALMSSGVFYWDKDKDGNYTKNNAGKDVVIQTFDKVTEGLNSGYNIYNGISEKLMSARFNKSGGYTRLASLVYKSATASSDTNVNLASESTQIYKDMCAELADKGVVYLGMQVSDSKGGTGKAVIRVVRRDLFKLN